MGIILTALTNMLSIIYAIHAARVMSRSTAQPSHSTTHAREQQRQILLWRIRPLFSKKDSGRNSIRDGTSDFSLRHSVRGSSRLRWVYCIKRALEREGEKLRTTATVRGNLRVLIENIGKEN